MIDNRLSNGIFFILDLLILVMPFSIRPSSHFSPGLCPAIPNVRLGTPWKDQMILKRNCLSSSIASASWESSKIFRNAIFTQDGATNNAAGSAAFLTACA
jgi:hypothetical protein